MAASDPVPCYYTGQDYRWERPACVKTRGEVRELKKWKLGKFVESGKIFLFFKRLVKDAVLGFWDGPLGRGNLIPFGRNKTSGDPLHYEIPRAGDKGMRRHNLYLRRDEHGIAQVQSRELRVSSRNLFSKQPIPMQPLTA
jgi:hypothetical protein